MPLNVIKPDNVLNKIRKIFAARSVILLIERFFRLGAGAIITIIVARMFGDEELGTYGLVMVWVAFLQPLTNLGMNNVVQKLASTQPNPQSALAVLQTAIWLRMAAGLWFGALMSAGFWLFYPDDLAKGPLSIITLFFLQSFFSLILYEYQQNYWGHFRAVALSKLGVSLLTLLIRIGGLLLGADIYFLLLVVAIEFLLTGLVQYYWYRRYAPEPQWLKWHKPDWQIARQLFGRASWLWISGIVSVIYLKIDLMMIEAMLGKAAAGQYVAVSRISELWYVIPVTLAARYYPQMLQTYQQSWQQYLLVLRQRSLQFFLLGCAIALVMTLCAYWLILLAFGEAFTGSTLVLQIHVWAGCFVFVRSLISQHLIITGQEPLSLFSHGLGAVINIAMNYLLIPRYGIEGAAWATLVSYAFASFFFIFFARTTRQQFFEMLRVPKDPALR